MDFEFKSPQGGDIGGGCAMCLPPSLPPSPQWAWLRRLIQGRRRPSSEAAGSFSRIENGLHFFIDTQC